MTCDQMPQQFAKAIAAAERLDLKFGKVQGFPCVTFTQWLATLEKAGRVEIGWRESCGSTHVTLAMFREWAKVLKALKAGGVQLSEERMKHKNAYASNNGGFWQSIVYSMPTPGEPPQPAACRGLGKEKVTS